MWDNTVAIDQQVKAEAYLLEHKPEGFKRLSVVPEHKRSVSSSAWG